jgi:hypothetical protein
MIKVIKYQRPLPVDAAIPDRLPENKLTTALESLGLMHKCPPSDGIRQNRNGSQK